jgi:hypothetical protein
MKRYTRGPLVAAVVMAGTLLVSLPASATSFTSTFGQSAAAYSSSAVKPPVIRNVRYTCHAEGATVTLRLRNPNRVDLAFQVRFSDGVDFFQAQAVTLPGKTGRRLQFDGAPNGTYTIDVLNDVGDTVASTVAVVECPPIA